MLLPVYIPATGGCLGTFFRKKTILACNRRRAPLCQDAPQVYFIIIEGKSKVQWEYFRKPDMRKKEPDRSLVLLFVLPLPIFPGRPTYCPDEETLRWSVTGRILRCTKKNQPFDWFFCLCWHYLSSRAVTRQVLSAYMSLTSVFGMGTGGPS